MFPLSTFHGLSPLFFGGAATYGRPVICLVMVLDAENSCPSSVLYFTVAVMSFWPQVVCPVVAFTLISPLSSPEYVNASPSTTSVNESNFSRDDGMPSLLTENVALPAPIQSFATAFAAFTFFESMPSIPSFAA